MTWDEPLPDGVYLGLKPKAYFRQESRGSTDWIKMHHNREGWWWGSEYNPGHVPIKRPYQAYGSGLHALILEGEDSYEHQFAAAPNAADYPGLVTTEKEIKTKLRKEGISLAGTSKFAKDDWNLAMLDNLPDVPCWDNIMEEFRARAGEKTPISAVDDRMIRYMREVALDPSRHDNAEVRRLLTPTAEHPILAEVSIFATIDGIRRRWRIDRMYPGLDMDLKSLGNWRGRPLPHEVGEVLARHAWDMQREDYYQGRTEAYRLIGEGRLYYGTIEQRRYIQQIAEENPIWDWLWLIYQKPEPTGRAPVIFPLWDDSWATLSDGTVVPGELRRYGRNKLNKAIAFYKAAVKRYGLHKPWARVEPVHYTDENHERRIFTPHWIQDDEPIVASAYGSDEEENDDD